MNRSRDLIPGGLYGADLHLKDARKLSRGSIVKQYSVPEVLYKLNPKVLVYLSSEYVPTLTSVLMNAPRSRKLLDRQHQSSRLFQLHRWR